MLIFEAQRHARRETRKLLLAFFVTVVLLVVAVNVALAAAWWLSWGAWVDIGGGLPKYFLEVNTAVTLLFVLGGWWLETSRLADGGGVRLAEHMGARPAHTSGDFDEHRFTNIVEEMAISSGMQRPHAMVVGRDEAINAFATGWNEDDAVVAVTRGALRCLSRAEVQGLVAHEFSHIREGDTRLNMRLVGMVFGLEMLYRMGEDMTEPDDRSQIKAYGLIGFALMGAGWLGWVAGRALQAAVSRQREFLADARAVQWTRSKDGLGGVLRKVITQREQGLVQAPSNGNGSVHHLLLVSQQPMRRGGRVAHWLDSHPTLDQRIQRIYGRSMPALPLVREDDDPAAPSPDAVASEPHIASAVAPGDGQGPSWTLV